MDHTNGSIKIILFQCTLWLAFAYILGGVAAFVPIYPTEETQPMWFQRSGSLVVVIAVWVEFKLFSLRGYFDKSAYSAPLELPKSFHLVYKTISTTAVFTAIVGTFIWGYGDLLL